MRKPLFILWICLAYLQGYAQVLDSLEIQSIEWVFPGSRGEIASREFHQLQTDFNFGEFLSSPSQTFNWSGNFRSSTMGFAFRVGSKKKQRADHSGILALRKQVINLDWYNGSNDSLTIDLSGRYEYFQIGLGYDYRSVNTKFLKLLSGVRMDVGLPVSGFQTEMEALESKFVSKGAVTFSATVNLVLEFRLFKKIYFKLGPSWGFGHYHFDGVSAWVPQSGLISGFKFGL
ncbi:MAG: hypothetical protein R8G66_23130 [Cytophagales bacterium]|nr:hypothetical protein [Cytophagales bacterium]